ncbi:MAG: hypothetical protein P1U52_05590 [Porticoccaceae bacterium]|nr:hypothetical protein [Porticoccaceae bacterium]
MLDKIRKWYEGKWVAYENPPNSSVVIIGGDYERHWTASVARVLVTFYLAHWKWLWGFAVSLVGVYLALQQLQAATQ